MHATDSKRQQRVRLAGVFCLVLGAHLWLISRYGNAVPFWDQWDAIADALLRPALRGELPWRALFAPHNEHRILWTRLTSLLLFEANQQQWDPILEMVFGALLTSLFAACACRILGRQLDNQRQAIFCCSLALLFAFPYGWENTLEGFGSQFIFLALFSLIAIDGLLSEAPSSPRWWLSILAGIAACWSMGSGFCVGLAVISVLLFRALRARAWPGLSLVPALLIAATALLIPHGHSQETAHNLHSFRLALLSTLAWPNVHSQISAILLWLPILLLAVETFRQREASPHNEVLLGIGAWTVLQAAAIAYARGRDGSLPVSRYMDCLACGVACNLAALLSSRKPRTMRAALALVWAALLLTGLTKLTVVNVRAELPAKLAQSTTQAASLKEFLRTRDPNSLRNKQLFDLPYPDPERLLNLLSDRALCAALPAEVQPNEVPLQSASRAARILLPTSGLWLLESLFLLGAGAWFSLSGRAARDRAP